MNSNYISLNTTLFAAGKFDALNSNSICWQQRCGDMNIINIIYSDLHNRMQQNMTFNLQLHKSEMR
jgi:hypothetical protein